MCLGYCCILYPVITLAAVVSFDTSDKRLLYYCIVSGFGRRFDKHHEKGLPPGQDCCEPPS